MPYNTQTSMKRERYQHIIALSMAAAGIGACAYNDIEPVPEAPTREKTPSTEVSPFDFELSPLTKHESGMSGDVLCTIPRIELNIPMKSYVDEITKTTWSSRREGQTEFHTDVQLTSYPDDPHSVSRVLSVPVDGSKMEQFEVKVIAWGPNGNIVGSDTESMEIGCIRIKPTPNPTD